LQKARNWRMLNQQLNSFLNSQLQPFGKAITQALFGLIFERVAVELHQIVQDLKVLSGSNIIRYAAKRKHRREVEIMS